MEWLLSIVSVDICTVINVSMCVLLTLMIVNIFRKEIKIKQIWKRLANSIERTRTGYDLDSG